MRTDGVDSLYSLENDSVTLYVVFGTAFAGGSWYILELHYAGVNFQLVCQAEL